MQTIQIEYNQSIAILKLNRGKANAMNASMINEIIEALLLFRTDEKVKGVILTGREGLFTAGLDVVELYSYNEQQMLEFWKMFARLVRRIVAFPKPIIAAISGHSPAGGCVMALGCDYRIMNEGDFKIGLNEIPFGIVVPDTIFNLYSFVVGKQNAYKYLLEGKLMNSSEALSCGLVDELVPAGHALDKAIEQMHKYIALPQGVWIQSKLNFRAGLLQTLNTDSNPSFEQTVKYWWAPETRALLKKIIQSLGKDVA